MQLTRCGANRRIAAAAEKPSENLQRCTEVAIEQGLPVLLAAGRGLEAGLFLALQAVRKHTYGVFVAVVGPEPLSEDLLPDKARWVGTANDLGHWLNEVSQAGHAQVVVAGHPDVVRANFGMHGTRGAFQSVVGLSVHGELAFVTLGGVRFTYKIKHGPVLKVSTNRADMRLESASEGIVSFGLQPCRAIALIEARPPSTATTPVGQLLAVYKAGTTGSKGVTGHMSVVATSNGEELCKAVQGDDVMAELCNCVVQSAWRHLEKSRCVVRAEPVAIKRRRHADPSGVECLLRLGGPRSRNPSPRRAARRPRLSSPLWFPCA